MQSGELRQKFLKFFEKNGHKIVPSSSLLPSDSSVLFTTAGMQQFKPYYLGEKSPYGKNVASCQKCIRTSDIDEVGDERHLTFFEMLGNFSFGSYFKEEAIKLAHEFIVKELGLKIDYITVFKGDENVPPDEESEKIWKKIEPKINIKKEGADNFWGPTGEEGPCGPTTEIYVNPSADDSGQAVEIWNIVFNEFFCDKNKKLTKLETPGVDTGMGLERLVMVVQKKKNVFETDLFEPIIKLIPDAFDIKKKRIIVDHLRSLVFLISDGVVPNKNERNYIPRLLIRNAMTAYYVNLKGKTLSQELFFNLIDKIIDLYKTNYPYLEEKRTEVKNILKLEWEKFSIILVDTIKDLKKIYSKFIGGIDPENTLMKIENNIIDLDGNILFRIRETHGVGLPVMKMIMEGWGMRFTEKTLNQYEKAYRIAQELSRTASAGMFKGGLADHEPETIKLHTAHHLLLAALQEVLSGSARSGEARENTIKQRGSNINQERLRIDFSFDRKLTDEEKNKIENIVNEKIKEGLLVVKKEMPKEDAQKIGAEMEFGVKYGNTVSVYFIQDKKGNIFSKEFCGGPHVDNTSELGKFKIIKEEAVSSGIRRIKAKLE